VWGAWGVRYVCKCGGGDVGGVRWRGPRTGAEVCVKEGEGYDRGPAQCVRSWCGCGKRDRPATAFHMHRGGTGGQNMQQAACCPGRTAACAACALPTTACPAHQVRFVQLHRLAQPAGVLLQVPLLHHLHRVWPHPGVSPLRDSQEDGLSVMLLLSASHSPLIVFLGSMAAPPFHPPPPPHPTPTTTHTHSFTHPPTFSRAATTLGKCERSALVPGNRSSSRARKSGTSSATNLLMFMSRSVRIISTASGL
jgi:hypothetical protein